MQVKQKVTGTTLVFLLLTACIPSAQPPTAETAATATPTRSASASPSTTIWQADGKVSDGEYAHQTTVGDVRVWWGNDAQYLYLAMEAPTTGWVSVGLDPQNRMQGANFIFGMVVDGQAQIWDAYGVGPTGPHPADVDLGGTSDIVAYGGIEENGVTRFEVQIPLDSGDRYDRPLRRGQRYKMITAVGTADDFDARHSSRATGEITLD